MTKLDTDVRVIDADTHFTEPPDLWTSRAPAAYRDRVLHIEDRDGVPTWIVDGAELGFATGGGVVDHDGGKIPFFEASDKGMDWVHPGAWDPKARLQVMDECGIHAQVLYPNRVGLGGHNLNTVVQDETLRMLCVEIYNDAMAEMQDESNLRFIPMPVMPAWDVDLCVKETERCARARAPWHQHDLRPAGPRLPRSREPGVGPALGGVRGSQPARAFPHRLEQHGHGLLRPLLLAVAGRVRAARDRWRDVVHQQRGVVINTVFAGIFDRFPALQMVSVESGIGWIPFILETMDYELFENAPAHAAALAKKPSEYFRSNWYGTFWFEENQGDVQGLLDKVGDDRVLFETDFPHPTCLYPAPLESVAVKMNALRPESRRRVMGENAARLYRI